MSCNTLATRYEPCKEFVGGLRGVFFVPYVFSNVVTKDVSGFVTSINNGATPTPVNATGYFWELKGLSTLEITETVSRDNGTKAYEQLLTLSFKPSGSTPATATADADLIDKLLAGRWRVIVWDRNDVFTLLGETEGMDANGGSQSWGVQMGDARINTITLQGMEKKKLSIVDAESYSDMSTVITIA